MIKYLFGASLILYVSVFVPITLAQAPTPEPVPTEQAIPAKPATREEAIALIEKTFADAPVMVKIAKAESRLCDPNWMVNPSSSARGCFQILKGTFENPAYGCIGDRMDYGDNIACAKKIYDRDGTAPWNASKSVWSK